MEGSEGDGAGSTGEKALGARASRPGTKTFPQPVLTPGSSGPDPPSTHPPVHILSFDLDDRAFGIGLAEVVRILPAVSITQLPGAPEVVEGVVDVSGSLVPVYDLRARLGLPGRTLHQDQHMILIQGTHRTALVRVDRVRSVESFCDAQLTPLETITAPGKRARFVARDEDGLVVVVGLADFLESEEEAALGAALNGADGARR